MYLGRSRSAPALSRILTSVVLCAFAAACSTASETSTTLALSNPAAGALATEGATSGVTPLAQSEDGAAAEAALPEKIAYLPTAKPEQGFPTSGETLAAEANDAAAGVDVKEDAGAARRASEQVLTAARQEPRAEQVLTAGQPAPAQKKGFLSLFATSQAAAAPAPQTIEQPRKLIAEQKDPQPLVQLAEAEIGDGQGAVRHSTGGYGSDALPGVRQTALFEIRRRSGIDDESDVDLNEDDGVGPIRVASAAGMARLSPNGLLRQNDTVDTACLKPGLVGVLKQIENHFGRKLVITSGYRNPTYNHRVGGAKNSQHMFCAAADIQVPGVTKWELAAFARSLPGRGGVGTYCHTESVHVDIGPERDWNWRCRRRKA